jgi:hemolysin activation/secretion protein
VKNLDWIDHGRCLYCEKRFCSGGKTFLVLAVLAAIYFRVMTGFVWAEEPVAFEIRGFEVSGNSLLDEDRIRQTMRPFIGPHQSAADVEQARDALEKVYHNAGYPAVFVNIPQQTVEKGIVRLEVIESRIGRVRVIGNRYFRNEKILKSLTSLSPGEILYVPKIQEELAEINRNPDLKVSPVLSPGRELGTIDVELKVKDKLPLHGSLELNNRSSHDTTDLRSNGLIRYDNLWQKEHSLSFQYQTSPEERDEVQAIAGSYVLPAPWKEEHLLALYGIWSDSDTAFGEGFEVVGRGQIFGLRYVMPLSPKGLYSHNVTAGLDYKDIEELLGFQVGGEDLVTPVTYMPLSFSYSASLPDRTGVTTFSGGLNMAFRGLVTAEEEFKFKRFKAGGNYIYATGGIERTQKLPKGLGLFVKLDGQISDQALISNEQYSSGGMKSVRGYKESEVLGDDAIHGTVELSWQNLSALLGIGDRFFFLPYAFYDYARLWVNDPLPGQNRSEKLAGTGIGVRGNMTRYLEYELNWGVALEDTDRTEKWDQRFYFMVKGKF